MDRKHCGKRRNCSLRAISLFPTVFSKGLYCRHVKPGLVWERVKHGYYLINKMFNTFPNKPWFLRVCTTSLWEKEKLFVTINFSFSHSVFYTFGELSAIFIKLKKMVICKLFQFGRDQNLLFGKGLN